MREIRFRAWDGERVVDGAEFVLSGNGMVHGEQKLTLMQYTGLKDKNGKDIYEGDILISADSLKTICTVEHGDWIGESANGVEEGHGFYFNGNRGKLGLARPNPKSRGYEIIGNIYENKELLT